MPHLIQKASQLRLLNQRTQLWVAQAGSAARLWALRKLTLSQPAGSVLLKAAPAEAVTTPLQLERATCLQEVQADRTGHIP